MTKKEIKAMSNEELIVQLVFAVHSFSRNYKIYKCDAKQYDDIAEEMNKRKIISKENVERIKKYTTF